MNKRVNRIKIKEVFTDDKGRVAVWQKPNLPLIGWFVFMVLSKLAGSDILKADARYLSSVCLIAWATLEIAYGSSYFRRILGVIVLAWIILSHL